MSAYWKSTLAALAAGIASLVTAVADGSITPAEWLIAVGAVVVALGGVALVPNAGFVNLNKLPEGRLVEAGAAARDVFESRLPGSSNVDRQAWTDAARTVVSTLRR